MFTQDTVDRCRYHVRAIGRIAPEFTKIHRGRIEFFRDAEDVTYAAVFFGEMLVDEFPLEIYT